MNSKIIFICTLLLTLSATGQAQVLPNKPMAPNVLSQWDGFTLWRGVKNTEWNDGENRYPATVKTYHFDEDIESKLLPANLQFDFSIHTALDGNNSGTEHFKTEAPYGLIAYNKKYMHHDLVSEDFSCTPSWDENDGVEDGSCQGSVANERAIRLDPEEYPDFYDFAGHAVILRGVDLEVTDRQSFDGGLFEASENRLFIKTWLCEDSESVKYICWSSAMKALNITPTYQVGVRTLVLGYDPAVVAVKEYAWNHTTNSNHKCDSGYDCFDSDTLEYYMGLDENGNSNDSVATGLGVDLKTETAFSGLKAWGFDDDNSFEIHKFSGYAYKTGVSGDDVQAVIRGVALGRSNYSEWQGPTASKSQVIACASADVCYKVNDETVTIACNDTDNSCSQEISYP